MGMNDSEQRSNYDNEYHDRQFARPYQSTVSFCDWLVELGVLGRQQLSVCDLGCGKGANLHYLSARFPACAFTGLDIDEQLIRDGNDYFQRKGVDKCRLVAGDLHEASTYFAKGEFDALISLQTLSWLPSYERALDAMVALSPNWIALTSLFFEGPIEARTVISDFDVGQSEQAKRSFFYNTYSLPMVANYLRDRGYSDFRHKRFDIPIDLPRGEHGRMQTYTELTADGRRLQVSGPLLMNWSFIFAAP
jgi:ubiquinone/menaquinone biosynthesis C-methylase UbiE